MAQLQASTVAGTLTTTGNVGIGTANTSAKLFIEGNDITLNTEGSAQGKILYFRYSNGANVQSDSYLYFSTGGSPTEKMRITDGGNVGIGTNNPFYKLDVKDGNIRITGSENEQLILDFAAPTGNYTYQSFRLNGTNKYRIFGYTSGDFALYSDVASQYSLYINSAGNVGINSTSPAYKLDVAGNARLTVGGTGAAYLYFHDTTTYKYLAYFNDDAYWRSPGGHYFEGLSGFKGVWNASGNLGIGTDNPTNKLEVYGGQIKVFVDGGEPGLQFWSGPSTQRMSLQWQTTANFVGIRLYNLDNSNLMFGTNSVERMRIDTDGRVGIGTISPALTSTGIGLNVVNSTYTQARFQSTNSSAGIEFKPSTGNNWEIQASNTAATSFLIYDRTNEAYRLVIDTSGEVGISTTNPTQKLDVRGTIYSLDSGTDGGQIRVQNSGGGNAWYWAARTTGLNLGQLGVADGRMFVNNDGNVGIGITTPTGKLAILAEVSNTPSLLFKNELGGPSSAISNFVSSAQTYTVIGTNLFVNNLATLARFDAARASCGIAFDEGNLIIATGTTGGVASLRLIVRDSGNVGIGTNNPFHKLDVRGAIVSDSQNNQSEGAFYLGNASHGLSRANLQNDIILYTTAGDVKISANTASNTQLIVKNNGNVGIGTTSPSGNLHIYSGLTSNNVRLTTGANAGTGYDINLYLNGGANNSEMSILMGIVGNEDRDRIRTYQGNMYFRTNDSENMILNSSGYVGIGTLSPTQKLSVEGGTIVLNAANAAANYYLLLNKKTGQDGGILFQRDNGNDWQQVNVTNGDMHFYSYGISSAPVVFQRSTGYVGIGTDNPRYPVVIWNRGPDGLQNRSLAIGNTNTNGTFMFLGTSATTGGYGIIQHISAENVSYGNLVLQPEAANVGIGNTNPARKLDVLEGNVQIVANFQNTSTTSSRIKFTDANTGAENVNIGATGTSLAMWTNNTVRMTITSGGNVGIGTVTTPSRLSITGDVTGTVPLLDLRASGTGLYQRGVRILNGGMSGGSSLMGFAVGRSDDTRNQAQMVFNYIGASSTSNYLEFGLYAVDNVLNIAGTGRVGVGITAPTHLLHVAGALRVDNASSFETRYTPNGEFGVDRIYGNNQDNFVLGLPDNWLAINVSGTDYVIPLYSPG